ncbi:hypothetical protein C2G38_2220070 [Gigaspora rosea]|uniref:Uncharacterized protein n=1 Tax=Gigaspora rosea TaxID=44941 RepID=A0A397U882_9GLOM|nr:hypothetical protein C2G38_2220070 [Gigaspora rosea]
MREEVVKQVAKARLRKSLTVLNKTLCLLFLRFTKEFCSWTSNNRDINQLIQQTQLNISTFRDNRYHWIPLSKRSFGIVFKAIWIDEYITEKESTKTRAPIEIRLKSLDNSKNIKQEFLEEIKNQYKHRSNSARVCIRTFPVSPYLLMTTFSLFALLEKVVAMVPTCPPKEEFLMHTGSLGLYTFMELRISTRI